jgi:serine protease
MKGSTSLLMLLLASIQVWSQSHVPGVLLVRLDSQTSVQQFLEDCRQSGGSLASLLPDRPISTELQIWRLRFDETVVDEFELLNQVRMKPRVLAVQFDHYVSKRGSWPEDPLFYQQWALYNNGFSGGTPGADIGALAAWDLSTGGLTTSGDTIVIAMIDDGVDIFHPDLKENLWINHSEIPGNGIDDDGNGYVDDYRGWNVSAGMDLIQYGMHGTQVAGVMAARGNNQTGLSSLNWHIKLMTVAGIGNLESQILEGFNYVLQQRLRYQQTNGQEGAFVVAINTSWGIDGGQASSAPLWCQFYDILGQAGILSVAAVANQNWNIDQYGDLPGTCSSAYLITVTSTDKHDQRGQAAWGPTHVDVAAPGIQVLTTIHGGEYAEVTGTSFAAPMVTSLAALLYAAPCTYLPELAKLDPAAATFLIRELLIKHVQPIPSLQNELVSGGRIQADQTLAGLMSVCESCLLPVALSTEISGNQTFLNWHEFDDMQVVELQWKPIGASVWQNQPIPSSPVALNGLSPCTAYEFRLGVWCADTQTILYTSSHNFYSHNCCLPPESWNVQTTSENSLTITVSPEPQASYLLRYRPLGQNLWHSQLLNDSGACTVSNLEACTWYELQISRYCPGQAEFFSERILAKTAGCGSCTDANYCSGGSDSALFEWIQSVELNDFLLTSGSDGGYGNHTGRPFVLHPDSLHQIKVTPGFSYSPYPQHYRIWIDLDQDGVFQHPEELILDSQSAATAPFEGSFYLPEYTMPGITRMRISMKWVQGNMTPPLPCEHYFFGETEDYCLDIQTPAPSTPCPTPPPPGIEWSGSHEVSISWQSAIATPTQIRCRKVGDIAWKYTHIHRLPHRLEQLMPCQEYEIQIQTSCENLVSPFSPSLFFSTYCQHNDGTEEPSGQQTNIPHDFSLYPNPWVSGALMLSLLPNPTETSYQLNWLNAQGKLLWSGELHTNQHQNQYELFIPDTLGSGIYFLYLTSEAMPPRPLKLVIAR